MRIERSMWAGAALLCCVCVFCTPPKTPSSGESGAPSSAQSSPPIAAPTNSEATSVSPTSAAPASVELSRRAGIAILCRVMQDLDRDGDRRITVEDATTTPPTAFPYRVTLAHHEAVLTHRHQAAQLVQELVRAMGEYPSREQIVVRLERAHHDPVRFLEERIESEFWPALTRQIDAHPQRLLRAAVDPKLGAPTATEPDYCAHADATDTARESAPQEPVQHVYVPADDPRAIELFSQAAVAGKLEVHTLPARPDANWVFETTARGRHGLLTLALDASGAGRPFVVPGGRFNEMYGWDSFFIVWGLVQSPRHIELARSMVDNQAYEIRHYGKVLNANRTYYLTRSQPPFFTSSIRAVLERLPRDAQTKAWLSTSLEAALLEYANVWSAAPRKLGLCEDGVCLARYFGTGKGEPPEVEPGHFDWFYQRYAASSGHCRAPTNADGAAARDGAAGGDAKAVRTFIECARRVAQRYRSGELTDARIDEFFSHDRCVRESGHDTTFRWFSSKGERCADFATVELNALLFKYETDLATLLAEHFDGEFRGQTTAAWCRRAAARKALMRRYHWDESSGLFFDYDVRGGKRSGYVSAAALVPLWASSPNVCGLSLLDVRMAQAARDAALPRLEAPGGLAATARDSLNAVNAPEVWELDAAGNVDKVHHGRQWEYPNGWAPHQMLAWFGLRNFGFHADAQRLALSWLRLIVDNAANYHGTVPEKFDVVKRTHRVFEEYGNVNTEFSYITREGFGWMNASFLVGLTLLDAQQRSELTQAR